MSGPEVESGGGGASVVTERAAAVNAHVAVRRVSWVWGWFLTRLRPPPPKLVFRRAKSFWVGLGKFTLHVSSVLIGIGFAILLFQSLMSRTISIEPISVPKTLAENGYTPDVAGQRLRDALNKFVENTHSSMGAPEISIQGELPKIVVPTVGLSIDSIASFIRTFLRNPGRQNIAGEFTVIDGKLWLRLRLNGRDFCCSASGVDPDELFTAAAPMVLQETRPYLVAWAKYHDDPRKAMEMAKGIIEQLPQSDENVAWSYVVVGRFYHDQNEYNQAFEAFKSGIKLNPNIATLHNNLASTLNALGKNDEAIAELHTAIKLNPKLAMPHNNLGVNLKDQGKIEEAIAEYRIAIKLDPKFAAPHTGLGMVLSEQKIEEAIAEFSIAIKLDPKDADPHHGLGLVLKKQGKTEEAIAEFSTAIKLDPKYAAPHNDLGTILVGQGKIEEANVEYTTATNLAPTAPHHSNLGAGLQRQGRTEEAIYRVSQ